MQVGSGISHWLGAGAGIAGPPIWVTHSWPGAQGHGPGGGEFGTHWQSALSQWSPWMHSTFCTQVAGQETWLQPQVPPAVGRHEGPANVLPSGQRKLGPAGRGLGH
jgi:hypothetical protein